MPAAQSPSADRADCSVAGVVELTRSFARSRVTAEDLPRSVAQAIDSSEPLYLLDGPTGDLLNVAGLCNALLQRGIAVPRGAVPTVALAKAVFGAPTSALASEEAYTAMMAVRPPRQRITVSWSLIRTLIEHPDLITGRLIVDASTPTVRLLDGYHRLLAAHCRGTADLPVIAIDDAALLAPHRRRHRRIRRRRSQ